VCGARPPRSGASSNGWDRLQAHCCRLVREHLKAQRGAIALEYVPLYASELNAVEYIWAYLKSHAMPNFCAKDLGEPRHHAGYQLRCMQRRTALIGVFWRQAELF
jgi:transposase